MRNCKNCGKELPDNQWCCNEKCVREYYKKKGAGKKYSTDNFCKNCGKELPESLQFCSKDCLDEFKFSEKHPSLLNDEISLQGLKFTDDNDLFTKWAKLNKKPDDECEICGKKIADYQRFCSRECVRKNKRRTELKKELEIYDDDYEKRIDDNYKLSLQHKETVRIIRETRPRLRKFSFEEWLFLRKESDVEEEDS